MDTMIGMSMNKITISRAASALKVNKKTLMRWGAAGKFSARREAATGARYYDGEDIENHVIWFNLRRKHKAHLRKLDAIRREVDKYINTQPLGPFDQPKFHRYEDMKKAFDALNKWEKEERAIMLEYSNLPRGFKAKVDPEY